MNYQVIMINTILLFFFVMQKSYSQISYFSERSWDSNSLSAIVDGDTIVLLRSENCISILNQLDFDGDGNIDVLASENLACGVCNGFEFFFFSQIEDKTFKQSKKFSFCMNYESSFKKHRKKWTVYLFTSDRFCFSDNSDFGEGEGVYTLKNGEVITKKSIAFTDIPAIQQVLIEQLDSISEIQFDLDNDKVPDKIELTFYATKFSTMDINITFSSGKKAKTLSATRRFGILASKTNGKNDLVLDFKDIYYWDGNNYVLK